MNHDEARARWAAMTHEERLAMAETAPVVAGPWKLHTFPDCALWSREDVVHGGDAANACGFPDGTWRMNGDFFPSAEAAKAEADKDLAEEGAVLL